MTQYCPVCDSAHDTWGGVAVHLWKKQDEDHRHVNSKDEGLIWLSQEGHLTGDTSPDTSPQSGADTDAPDTPAATATDGGATTLDVPSGPDDSTPAQDRESATRDAACPQCDRGPEKQYVYRSDEYLEKAGSRLPRETYEAIEKHEFVCANCWKGFDS